MRYRFGDGPDRAGCPAETGLRRRRLPGPGRAVSGSRHSNRECFADSSGRLPAPLLLPPPARSARDLTDLAYWPASSAMVPAPSLTPHIGRKPDLASAVPLFSGLTVI